MPDHLLEWRRRAEFSTLQERVGVSWCGSLLPQALHDDQILIVVRETGSGKTTQITQDLAEAGGRSAARWGACVRSTAALRAQKGEFQWLSFLN